MHEQERIERFKYLTEVDPANELGWFSLGRAYIDGGQAKEAVPPLQRVLALNPNFSKAYALLGHAQKASGDTAGAIQTLTAGYRIANDRGDLMPRNDMAALLKELGAPIPEIKAEELTDDAKAAGKIKCRRCNRIAPRMAEPPFSGPDGEKLQAQVCAPCFKEWIGQGTKVINELRLNLTEKMGQDIYDQHMKQFLNIE